MSIKLQQQCILHLEKNIIIDKKIMWKNVLFNIRFNYNIFINLCTIKNYKINLIELGTKIKNTIGFYSFIIRPIKHLNNAQQTLNKIQNCITIILNNQDVLVFKLTLTDEQKQKNTLFNNNIYLLFKLQKQFIKCVNILITHILPEYTNKININKVSLQDLYSQPQHLDSYNTFTQLKKIYELIKQNDFITESV